MVRRSGVLLWLAGTASSIVVTLGSMQKLPALIPLSCVLAYKSRLGKCSIDDLTSQACSPECRASVAETQTSIQSICTMMQLDEDALLSRAQQGALVIVLCGNGRPDSTSTKGTTGPSTTTGTETETVTVTRSQSGSRVISFISTSTTRSSKISTSAETTLQRTTALETTLPTTPVTRISDTLAQPVPSTTTAASRGEEQQASSSNSAAPQLPAALSPVEAPTSKAQESTPKSGSGGGSPFDFSSSGSEGKGRRVATMSSAVVFAAMVLLAR